MSDYRLALDHTSETLVIRARTFRNLVVAFVVIGLASVGGVLAQFSLWPASGLLLLAPAYGAFLCRDSVILGRWRAQLCEAWTRRAIDFSALRHALNANPTLPQSTLQGMLETLPAADDLLTEQTVSETTREAIVSAVDARDRSHTDRLVFLSGGFAVAAFAILLAIQLSVWMPLLAGALLPVLAVVCFWSRRRRFAKTIERTQVLRRSPEFDAIQYLDIVKSLDWEGNSPTSKARLLDLVS